jgi:hypothetical protein
MRCLTAVAASVAVLSLVLAATAAPVIHHDSTETTFAEWAVAHGKVYTSSEERSLRLSIFAKSLERVRTHNAKYEAGEKSYFLALNRFSDLTFEEKSVVFGAKRPTQALADLSLPPPPPVASIPDSVDWRAAGKVPPIKDQGQCGSCWAFSAVGAMESAQAIANNFTWPQSGSNIGYSEAEVVDCTPDCFGCQGGWPRSAYNFIAGNGGIDSEADWPYFGPVDGCDAGRRTLELAATVKGYVNVTRLDESALQQAISQQPVSIAIAANCDAFMSYGGGVLSDSCSDQEGDIDHAIIAVGYNLKPANTKDAPYYIVRNSWGTGWGEDGYVRMAIGTNIDCIACEAIYPVAAAPLPTPPPLETCPTGTTDPKSPLTCPQGSTCCCSHHSLFEKRCQATQCCTAKQTCTSGKGCH